MSGTHSASSAASKGADLPKMSSDIEVGRDRRLLPDSDDSLKRSDDDSLKKSDDDGPGTQGDVGPPMGLLLRRLGGAIRARRAAQGRFKKLNTFRHKVGEFLESQAVQRIIIVLIIIDVLILAAETVLEREDPHPSHEIHVLEQALFYATVAILGAFLLELLLLLFAFGVSFFKHPLYVVDLVVITGALFLELFFRAEVASLLAVTRLWRVIRIAHGIVEAQEEAHHTVKVRLDEERKTRKQLEAEVASLKKELQRYTEQSALLS